MVFIDLSNYYELDTTINNDGEYVVTHPTLFPTVQGKDMDYYAALSKYNTIINTQLHIWLSAICAEISIEGKK